MTRPLLFLLALSSPLAAQGLTALPEEFTMAIPPGGWVDLDTGMVLPAPQAQGFSADLRFDRDGEGFFLELLHGGMAAPEDAIEPDGDWSQQRQRIARRERSTPTWFAKTDRGCVARVTLAVLDAYTTSTATLRWVTQAPAQTVFPPAPSDIAFERREDGILVSWSGDSPRYLVQVSDGNESRRETTGSPEILLPPPPATARCRVRVWGLDRNGVLTRPAELSCTGAAQPALRSEVEYPDRWYDDTGGLSLSRAEAAREQAEVAFYLYGVYVSGGGVQKVGRGEAAYRALTELPAAGYLPIYGRLDSHDVLAVRVANGSYGKLMLVPADGRDLRDGMTVRVAFLPDGRRSFVPPPAGIRFEATPDGTRLSWRAAPGATGYEVRVAGEPLRVADNVVVLDSLAPDRFHEVTLATLAGDDRSDAVAVPLHTFGDDYRVGTVTLDVFGRDGFDVVGDAVRAADGEDAGTIELRVTNSAGGASSLQFGGTHGIAPAGDTGFGDFEAAPPASSFRESLGTDDRRPRSETFFVRTREGQLAVFRIKAREFPQVTLDYVVRLKR